MIIQMKDGHWCTSRKQLIRDNLWLVNWYHQVEGLHYQRWRRKQERNGGQQWISWPTPMARRPWLMTISNKKVDKWVDQPLRCDVEKPTKIKANMWKELGVLKEKGVHSRGWSKIKKDPWAQNCHTPNSNNIIQARLMWCMLPIYETNLIDKLGTHLSNHNH